MLPSRVPIRGNKPRTKACALQIRTFEFSSKKEHLGVCLALAPAVFYSIYCLTAIRNLFVISPLLGIHLVI